MVESTLGSADKSLLATTMLAGTAGFAAAESHSATGVSISGYAEIGILNSEALTGALSGQSTFHQDVEVTFKMSGETDGGLSFGAAIDLDETNVALANDSGTTVFVSGAFGKLTMGDTDGALDWAVQDAGSLTSMGDDHTTHAAYFSANGIDGSHDGQILRYEYSFGDFGVAVSYEQSANGAPTIAGVAAGDDNVGIGATYAIDLAGTAVKLGVGYQTGTISQIVAATPGVDGIVGTADDVAPAAAVNGDVWGLSVGAELAGGFSGMIGYTDTSTDPVGGDFSNLGLGVTYTSGPLSVHMNYGEVDNEVAADFDSYGLAVNYDLGGGAVVMAGYGSDLAAAPGNQSQYSIGLGLSF